MTAPERLAAVDLGSNSFHMVVARNHDGQPEILDRLREPVRLGMGVTRSGRISEDAQKRALACLARFGERIRHFPPEAVRAVGTNAFRAARRGEEFLQHASGALGHEIEVVSGQEEARLVHLGVLHSTHAPGERCLVVDIGGGSTEVIAGTRDGIQVAHSLPMGCVSFTRRYFPEGAITQKQMRKARRKARFVIEPHAEQYEDQWEHALGSSGTIRALGQYAARHTDSEGAIDRPTLKRIRQEVIAAGHAEALPELGVSEARRAIFAAGLAVLSGLFDVLRIPAIVPADGALREGVLYDLAGRIRADDVRDHTVAHVQGIYRVDREQAARVRSTARRLFEQVYATWELPGPEGRQLLVWASALHEVGLSVAHARHQRHAAYLLRHANLPGFSQTDQALIATLVGQQRGRIDLDAIERLPTAWHDKMLRLLALFRIAVGLHRNRRPGALPPIACEAGPSSLSLTMQDGWLAQHPLTRAQLARQAKQLRRVGLTLSVT